MMIKSLDTESESIVQHKTRSALGTTGNDKALETIEKYINHKYSVISESAKITKERIEVLTTIYSGARHYTENHRHRVTLNN